MCIDLDIAVEAGSRSAAEAALEAAVISYLKSAQIEGPDQARRLIARRAPWWVRWGIIYEAFVSIAFKRRDGHGHATFDMTCPA
jgi:hypothetical protein